MRRLAKDERFFVNEAIAQSKRSYPMAVMIGSPAYQMAERLSKEGFVKMAPCSYMPGCVEVRGEKPSRSKVA